MRISRTHIGENDEKSEAKGSRCSSGGGGHASMLPCTSAVAKLACGWTLLLEHLHTYIRESIQFNQPAHGYESVVFAKMPD